MVIQFILGLCLTLVVIGINLLFYWLGWLALGAATEDYHLGGVAGAVLFCIIGVIAISVGLAMTTFILGAVTGALPTATP